MRATSSVLWRSSVVAALTLAGAALGLLPSACKTEASDKKAYACVPGQYYYCQCVDRQPGQRECLDDRSFGSCEPCESDTNPALPDDDDEPVPIGDDDDDVPDGSTSGGRCGDGTVDEGEACDDGNQVEDDGCDSRCTIAGSDPRASRSCPGLPVHLWPGRQVVTFAGSTSGAPNTGSVTPACLDPSGTSSTGSLSSDRVFFVTAHGAGKVTVKTSDATFDHFLWVTKDCKSGGASALYECSNQNTSTAGETLTFAVESGKSYSVFVDGVKVAQGGFKVSFSLP